MKTPKGFSLLETLVALAVFATAAMGITALNTNSVRISQSLEERVLARVIAENVAIDTVTDPSLQVVGRTVGKELQRRRAYTWERMITPASSNGLLQIDIVVRSENNNAALSQVTTLHYSERES